MKRVQVRKDSAKSSSIGLEVDGKVCFDKATVDEKFNNFFVIVASNLVRKLPVGSVKYELDFVDNFNQSGQGKQNAFNLSQVNMMMTF